MPRFQIRLVHLMGLVVVAALLSAFVAAARRARTAARAAQCINTPKFLGLMLYNDFDRTGKARPAVERDGLGRPIHSWRAVVWVPEFFSPIPYDLAQPWDSPANLPAAEHAPDIFACHNAQRLPTAFTNVAAIVDGEDCSLELLEPSLRARAWPMLVEVPESTIRWTEPRDVSPEDIAMFAPPSDPGGYAVGLSDGSTRRLSRDEILEGWARARAALRALKDPGR